MRSNTRRFSVELGLWVFALRNGYAPYDFRNSNYYVRMSKRSSGVAVEVCHIDSIRDHTNFPNSTGKFIVWWDNPEGLNLIDEIRNQEFRGSTYSIYDISWEEMELEPLE